MTIIVPKIKEATVRQEGARVLLIVDGRTVLEVPWQAADQLSRAFAMKARQAEEIAKAANIADDAAILLRAGVPVGLTNNPKIQEMAKVAAISDRKLRRAMPGGVKSQTMYGTPAVRVHKRTP